jgi:hypothetical protein
LAHRFAERGKMVGEQGAAGLEQANGEEPGRARNAVMAVICHGVSVPGDDRRFMSIGANAWAFVAASSTGLNIPRGCISDEARLKLIRR